MIRELIFVLLLGLALPGFAGFQHRKPQTPPGQKPADMQNGMKERIMNSPAMQKLEAARSLALTPNQQTQLTALENKCRQEMMELRDQMKGQRREGQGGAGGESQTDRKAMMQELRPKMESISREISTGIDAILTSEQRAEIAQKSGQFAGRPAGAAPPNGRFHPGGNLSAIPAATPLPMRAVLTPAIAVTDRGTSNGLAVVNPFTP